MEGLPISFCDERIDVVSRDPSVTAAPYILQNVAAQVGPFSQVSLLGPCSWLDRHGRDTAGLQNRVKCFGSSIEGPYVPLDEEQLGSGGRAP